MRKRRGGRKREKESEERGEKGERGGVREKMGGGGVDGWKE